MFSVRSTVHSLCSTLCTVSSPCSTLCTVDSLYSTLSEASQLQASTVMLSALSVLVSPPLAVSASMQLQSACQRRLLLLRPSHQQAFSDPSQPDPSLGQQGIWPIPDRFWPDFSARALAVASGAGGPRGPQKGPGGAAGGLGGGGLGGAGAGVQGGGGGAVGAGGGQDPNGAGGTPKDAANAGSSLPSAPTPSLLPPRDPHPVLTFKSLESEPPVPQGFPVDKYDLEPAPVLAKVFKGPPGTCWEVYVQNSRGAHLGYGDPCG